MISCITRGGRGAAGGFSLGARGRAKAAALALVFCAAGIYGQQPQKLRNFRLPDYDENGNLKAELQGETGTILADGRFDITNLRMTFYEQGQEAMVITAPRCLYDKDKQTAESESEILVERSELRMSGEGFKFHVGRKQLRVEDKTKVVLRSVRDDLIAESEP